MCGTIFLRNSPGIAGPALFKKKFRIPGWFCLDGNLRIISCQPPAMGRDSSHCPRVIQALSNTPGIQGSSSGIQFTAGWKCLGVRTAQTSDPLHQVLLVWGEIQVLHQGVEGGDERSFHQGCLLEAADAGFCNTAHTAGHFTPDSAPNTAQTLHRSTDPLHTSSRGVGEKQSENKSTSYPF